MERFVRLLVVGGLAMVAGLWMLRLAAPGSGPWLLGAAVAVLGSGSLVAGIAGELDVDWR